MNNRKKIKLGNPWKKRRYMNLAKKKTEKSKIKTKLALLSQRKGSVYFKHHRFSYRLPVVLLFLALLMMIVVIPTLIVMPSGSEEATSPQEELATDDHPEAVSVAVMRTSAGVVEDVPLEEYIVGVVAAEMPAEFEVEALKAQALAARTYAVTHLFGGEENEDYDITDTTQHQVYKNTMELQQQWGSDYEENIGKIKAAVEATHGEIITYDERPIMPAYFSMSNGYTENSEDYWENELPYLRSVPSPWELEHPKLIDQETFTKTEIEERLDISLSDAASHDISISRTDSGRVHEFVVEENTFTGRDVRDALGLRSSDFSVKQNDEHFIFTTKGNGHGIGMSQYGANAMAEEGKTYEDIIKYYYQGVEITTLEEAAPTLVFK